jgi:type II secretory pathway pseudopilin PulG
VKGYISRLFSINKRALRRGFTLLELVVFTAIFSLIIIAFISVLVSITRTQVRQTAVTEVNQQSQFVLQAMQYYVERSSIIEGNADAATTSIKLRMTSSAEDPTLVFASGTQIFSQVGAGAAQAITSNRVLVANFSMAKHSNSGGKDTLAVSFVISYNTANFQQQFTQVLSSAVARVNAATFDSDVNPTTNGTLNVGGSGSYWSTINGIIKFNSADSNAIGVGGVPGTGFNGIQVSNGGDVYVDTAGKGIVLKNGTTCYRITVNASGNIATGTATCY